MNFIELRVITKNKESKTVIEEEAVQIEDIRSFRPWKKGDKDTDVSGEITLLIVRQNIKQDVDAKNRQIHINEPYKSFVDRLRKQGANVIPVSA